MKHGNDNAMGIGVAAFGLFCLVIVIAGIIYVSAMSTSQVPITDTYGNTLNPTSNTSQQLVTSSVSAEEYSAVPLVLIGATMFLCIVVFSLWVYSKTGISL